MHIIPSITSTDKSPELRYGRKATDVDSYINPGMLRYVSKDNKLYAIFITASEKKYVYSIYKYDIRANECIELCPTPFVAPFKLAIDEVHGKLYIISKWVFCVYDLQDNLNIH